MLQAEEHYKNLENVGMRLNHSSLPTFWIILTHEWSIRVREYVYFNIGKEEVKKMKQ